MSPHLHESGTGPEDAYRALLEVAESIALHRDLAALFHDLAQRLHRVVRFDFLLLILHEPSRATMRLHVLESAGPAPLEPGLELPVEDSPSGLVWQTQEPLILGEPQADARFGRVRETVHQQGIHSVCLLPLTTAHRRLGALGFGSRQTSAYAPADLEFLAQVAAQVAVAVDNALNAAAAESLQRQLARERDRLRAVLEVTNVLVSELDVASMFRAASAAMRRVVPHDLTSLIVADPDTRAWRRYSLTYPLDRAVAAEELPPEDAARTPAARAIELRSPVRVDVLDETEFPSPLARRLLAEGVRSVVSVPLVRGDRVLGALNLAARRERAFTRDDEDLLAQIANEVAIAVENAQAYRQIAALKDKLATEKHYLEDEIRTEYNFEEMIGESPAWKAVLHAVETVAPTDSTVLIQGESGTGKELIARAIHNLSRRSERTFVKVNCSAIPTGLLESELFGHEKGAFTGAIAQRLGRFELADGGTLLLDEIGDIPLELQPKLLRVLQEREFERLGSSRTTRVDVRLITSTNRDLPRMVADREFRGDLFYRLNVFPIRLPPLRERRDDIPLLARYFTARFARRMNKPIESISDAVLEALAQWPWPGNVRELENFIERAVILTRGSGLQAPLSELRGGAENGSGAGTLADVEREAIQRALEQSGGVLGGPRGAAARLGMKRTTLQSRMQKLGIQRR